MTLTESQKSRAKFFMSDTPETDVAYKESQYRGLLDETMKFTGGNVAAALDTMLMDDKVLREGLNRSLSQKGSKYRIGYFNESTVLGETEDLQRAAGIYDTTTAISAGNLIQTTVADYIMSRVEELGQVVGLTSRFQLATGNLSVPKISANPTATFGLDGAPLLNGNPDIGTTVITPNQYGMYFNLTLAFLAKVNPKNIFYIMEKLAEGMARAGDLAVVSGSGLGGNPLGLTANATSVAAGTYLFDTVDTIIQQASLVRIPMDKLTLLLNGALLGLGMKQRRSGTQFGNWVVMDPGSKTGTIDGVKFVVTEQIANTGTVGSQTANLLAGNFDHYIWADNGQVKVVIDNYTGLTNLTQKIVTYGFAGGTPEFNDSFFKSSTTTGL